MKKKYIILSALAVISMATIGIKVNTDAADIEHKMVRNPIVIKTLSVEQEQEENENERIEQALLDKAHTIENCRITYYCTCKKCCGKADGITFSGVEATPYVTCAVDPCFIPIGSDILIDYGDGELHYMRADDTGGGVHGSSIDVCVGSHEEALNLGVKRATIYWIEQ